MDYNLEALKLLCIQLNDARKATSEQAFTLDGILIQRSWLQVYICMYLYIYMNVYVYVYICNFLYECILPLIYCFPPFLKYISSLNS